MDIILRPLLRLIECEISLTASKGACSDRVPSDGDDPGLPLCPCHQYTHTDTHMQHTRTSADENVKVGEMPRTVAVTVPKLCCGLVKCC